MIRKAGSAQSATILIHVHFFASQAAPILRDVDSAVIMSKMAKTFGSKSCQVKYFTLSIITLILLRVGPMILNMLLNIDSIIQLTSSIL